MTHTDDAPHPNVPRDRWGKIITMLGKWSYDRLPADAQQQYEYRLYSNRWVYIGPPDRQKLGNIGL